MKNQIIVIAAVLAIAAPGLALAAPAPGFYINTQRLNPAHIERDVDNFGAAAIRFVPPPALAAPIKLVTECGRFRYSFTYFPHAKNHHKIWENDNGKAMSEKMIRACTGNGALTVRFSPIVKK